MKPKRQEKILEIIKNQAVETQGELTRLLAKAGFDVTQATVSRDIHEMKLTKKMTSGGTYKYALPDQMDDQSLARLRRVFKEGFVSMDYAGNLLVIRTLVGMAMAVAAALDAQSYDEILGSVAGDDVVLCVVKSEDDALKLMGKLKSGVMRDSL